MASPWLRLMLGSSKCRDPPPEFRALAPAASSRSLAAESRGGFGRAMGGGARSRRKPQASRMRPGAARVHAQVASWGSWPSACRGLRPSKRIQNVPFQSARPDCRSLLSTSTAQDHSYSAGSVEVALAAGATASRADSRFSSFSMVDCCFCTSLSSMGTSLSYCTV